MTPRINIARLVDVGEDTLARELQEMGVPREAADRRALVDGPILHALAAMIADAFDQQEHKRDTMPVQDSTWAALKEVGR